LADSHVKYCLQWTTGHAFLGICKANIKPIDTKAIDYNSSTLNPMDKREPVILFGQWHVENAVIFAKYAGFFILVRHL